MASSMAKKMIAFSVGPFLHSTQCFRLANSVEESRKTNVGDFWNVS